MRGKRLLEFRKPRTGKVVSFRTKSLYIFPDGRCWDNRLRRFVKQRENHFGYMCIDLKDDENNWQKSIRVHDLVASVFLRLLEQGEEVHHVDHCKTNNDLSNLEIIPASVHAKRHAIEKWKNGRMVGVAAQASERSKKGWAAGAHNVHIEKMKNVGTSRPAKQVAQLDMDRRLVNVWPSAKECHRNGYMQSAVSNCCNGKGWGADNHTYKNYRWQWYAEYISSQPTKEQQFESRQLNFDFSE